MFKTIKDIFISKEKKTKERMQKMHDAFKELLEEFKKDEEKKILKVQELRRWRHTLKEGDKVHLYCSSDQKTWIDTGIYSIKYSGNDVINIDNIILLKTRAIRKEDDLYYKIGPLEGGINE